MNDLISRQAMLDGLASIAKAKAKSDAQKALMGRVMFFTEHLPPVTPKPKMGRWIEKPHVYGVTYCSLCDYELHTNDTNFCPNCGANMGESEDNKHDDNN